MPKISQWPQPGCKANLTHEVGCVVEGVVGSGVIEAAAGSGRTKEIVGRRILSGGVQHLGVFNREAEEGCLADILGKTKAIWRDQTKPALYCASMVAGRISVPRVRPAVVSVTSDHPWPPETSQPLLVLASAHN